MSLPADGVNANTLAETTTIPTGKKLIFLDSDTNEGGIITLENLTKQILSNLTSQTFNLDQGNKTLLAALNELNSKPGKNIISIAGCTAAQTSLSNYLKGKTAKVTFFAFYSLTENPFSFDQGFCIAFNSSGIMQDNLFVLVGISRDGNKIETKQMNIK